MDQQAILELAKQFSVTSTQEPHFIIERAEGPFVWDREGKRYFDFTSGVGVANLGYKIPKIREAIVRQLESGVLNFDDNLWPNPWATLLRKRLSEVTPGRFPKKVFLSNSGAEAIEAAIKILVGSRPERTSFIAFDGAFHGRTGYALALNGSKIAHRKYFPKAFTVYRLPFPDESELGDPEGWLHSVKGRFKNIIPFEEVNAVFLEWVQGEGGVNIAAKSPMVEFLAFVREHDIFIVTDEIQTGFYRTGRLWAGDHYGFEPDIMCLGKSLAAGIPMGATVIRENLDFTERGRHSNTFGGNAVASVAALTNLEIMESLDRSEIEAKANLLKEFAPEGLGLMRRRRFGNAEIREKYIAEALEKGVILFASGEKSVRFMPPVTISREELKAGIRILQSIHL